MATKVEAKKVQAMFGDIAGRYDLTNTVLSLGIHHLWRQSLIKMAPELKDGLALDVCTGTGDLLPLLKKRFGSSVGMDFSFPMLAEGMTNSRAEVENGLCPRIQGDALALPFPSNHFDVLSVSFGVRNLERLNDGLGEMKRVLKPGGSLLVLEFGQPKNKSFSSIYNWYSKHIMPAIGGLLTGNRDAYEYLPETAASFPCAKDFCDVLESCGFQKAEFKTFTFGIAYAYQAIKP